jgi:hypothetical protein
VSVSFSQPVSGEPSEFSKRVSAGVASEGFEFESFIFNCLPQR